jgi:hypothetical protein
MSNHRTLDRYLIKPTSASLGKNENQWLNPKVASLIDILKKAKPAH